MSTTEKFVLDLDGLLPVDVLTVLNGLLRSHVLLDPLIDRSDLLTHLDEDLRYHHEHDMTLGEYFELVEFYETELAQYGVTVTGC